MTNKERFFQALHAESDSERLVNFKLFPGSDRNASADDIYGALANALQMEQLGLLDEEVDLLEEEKDLHEVTIEDIRRL